MKRRFVRVMALLLCLLLAGGALVSCGETRRVRANARAERTVAKAGDLKIPYENYYYLVMTKRGELESDGVRDAKTLRAELASFADANLVTKNEALIALGYDYDLDTEKGDLGKQVDAHWLDLLESEFGGDRKAYIASLDAAYLTDHYVRRYIGVENYLSSAIVKEMLIRGELDTSDTSARALIESDRFARTIHVFVEKNNRLYSEAENRAHAEEIVQSVRGAGDEAARLAEMRRAIGGKYNNDYADTLGNGYYFTYGEMDAAYETAAFALAEYDVSDVVETERGYFVLMRLPKEAAYIEENFEVLKNKSYFVTLNEKVEAKLAEMHLQKTKFGASLDPLALPAIHAGGGEAVPYIIGAAAGVCAVALFVVLFRFYHGKTAAKPRKKGKKS